MSKQQRPKRPARGPKKQRAPQSGWRRLPFRRPLRGLQRRAELTLRRIVLRRGRPIRLRSKNLRDPLTMLALFIIALILRLYRLDGQSLWLDEGSSWNLAQQSWGVLIADLWNPNAAYPLYHLILKAWSAMTSDSEWALRLPSALAGAAAVPALYALGRRVGGRRVGVGAALLGLISPLAQWHSQDAKAYALLLLLSVLWMIAFWDALMLGKQRRWATLAGLTMVGVLLHRASLVLPLGGLIALVLPGMRRSIPPRWRVGAIVGLVLLGLVAVLGTWNGVQRAEGAALPGAPIAPHMVVWYSVSELALLYHAPHVPGWTAVPALVLLGVALWRLFRERRSAGAAFLLGHAVVPLLLFSALLAVVGPLLHYDARYLTSVLPAYLVLLAWPVGWLAVPRTFPAELLGLTVLAGLYVLFAPPAGLLSGHPVREDYRSAMTYLAQQVHPGEPVIVSPPSALPLYAYYATRVTPDELPPPRTMDKAGVKGYPIGDFDDDLDALLRGSPRAWLIQAPAHALKIDPPPTAIDAELQLDRQSIHFFYAEENRRWRCGDGPWKQFLGVRVYCQAFPELYQTGQMPQPETPLRVRFGPAIDLLGYTLHDFDHDGVAMAGGSIPITLFWRSTRQLTPDEDYVIFLHLVPELGRPPVAQQDIPPQLGGLSTTTWKGDLVHDEHAIPLPADLAPGRYQLLLGLVDPNEPSIAGRLPISGTDRTVYERAVVLTTIEVRQP